MSKQVTMPEAVAALASISAASGRILPAQPAKGDKPATPPSVELTLETEENGPLVLSLDQFDNIYKGMVRCWPTIKPLKNQLAIELRNAAAADRQAKKDAEKAEREAIKKKKQEEREAAAKKKAEEKAAKEKKAADDKAAKEKADKEAKAKKEKDAKAAKAKEAKK